MGIIKEKMIQDLVIRGMSKRTQENYLGCIKQFVKHYMKSPDLSFFPVQRPLFYCLRFP